MYSNGVNYVIKCVGVASICESDLLGNETAPIVPRAPSC